MSLNLDQKSLIGFGVGSCILFGTFLAMWAHSAAYDKTPVDAGTQEQLDQFDDVGNTTSVPTKIPDAGADAGKTGRLFADPHASSRLAMLDSFYSQSK